MSGDDDRHIQCCELPEHAREHLGILRRDATIRLVREETSWPAHQHGGQLGAVNLAAGERPWALVEMRLGIDGDRIPPAVAKLRAVVGNADGILICSPEYAHGIPGSLKNLLDWLVGSVEFPFKPVASLKANAHSVHAQAQLVEVLTTMMRGSSRKRR